MSRLTLGTSYSGTIMLSQPSSHLRTHVTVFPQYGLVIVATYFSPEESNASILQFSVSQVSDWKLSGWGPILCDNERLDRQSSLTFDKGSLEVYNFCSNLFQTIVHLDNSKLIFHHSPLHINKSLHVLHISTVLCVCYTSSSTANNKTWNWVLREPVLFIEDMTRNVALGPSLPSCFAGAVIVEESLTIFVLIISANEKQPPTK